MATSTKSKILEHLNLLQFKVVNQGKINEWTKSYNGCEINVNLESGWVEYPVQLKIHNYSTSKLNNDEDLVVLECVDRLLTKGYPANKIELEKTWKVGVNESGRLDVLVRCKDSKEIYLMIECKTENRRKNALVGMKYNGGQLFSYFQQDRSAKFLCLYVSWTYKFRLRYKYYVVSVDQSMCNSNNVIEMYEKWDKKFFTGGDIDEDMIFGDDVAPYDISVET